MIMDVGTHMYCVPTTYQTINNYQHVYVHKYIHTLW